MGNSQHRQETYSMARTRRRCLERYLHGSANATGWEAMAKFVATQHHRHTALNSKRKLNELVPSPAVDSLGQDCPHCLQRGLLGRCAVGLALLPLTCHPVRPPQWFDSTLGVCSSVQVIKQANWSPTKVVRCGRWKRKSQRVDAPRRHCYGSRKRCKESTKEEQQQKQRLSLRRLASICFCANGIFIKYCGHCQ